MLIWTVFRVADRECVYEGSFSEYGKASQFVDNCKADPRYDGWGIRIKMETLDIQLVEETA